jgi:uncharacterized protein YidB (DUF937 family)
VPSGPPDRCHRRTDRRSRGRYKFQRESRCRSNSDGHPVSRTGSFRSPKDGNSRIPCALAVRYQQITNSALAGGHDVSILDQMLGGLSGGGSPLKAVLANLLTQGRGEPDGRPKAGGELTGLIATFEQAGMGNIIQSWVGTGSNQPVSPGQLHAAFGDTQVQSMAREAGVPPQDFLSLLSQHLPQAIDRATPGGRLPDEQATT